MPLGRCPRKRIKIKAYRELGETYLDALHQKRSVQHLVQRIQKMGYSVNITELPAAAAVGSFS
jgi:hypothetical protein